MQSARQTDHTPAGAFHAEALYRDYMRLALTIAVAPGSTVTC